MQDGPRCGWTILSGFGQVEVRSRKNFDLLNLSRYPTMRHMDKREAVRVPVRVTARCRSRGVVIDGIVEDLSRSGLFLRAPKLMEAGSSAELELELPGEPRLHLHAEVVRLEHSAERAGMGLRLILQADDHLPLANFIMRQHATLR